MKDGLLLGDAAGDPDDVLTFIRASLASQSLTSDKLPEIRRAVEEYFDVQQEGD